MQSVNSAQFLNTPCLFLSSAILTAKSAPALVIAAVPFRSLYASLLSQRLNFNIVVIDLIWLLVLHVSRATSFISTQFFVLNLNA